jgi:bla regulator protein blaR1
MVVRLAVLFFAAAALTGSAQSPQLAAPSFEVASIKRNVSDEVGGYVRIEEGARFNAANATLNLIIRQAYGIQAFQVANLPDWVNTERYDIRAKAPDGVEVFANMPQLLRSLLKERFGLQAHTEPRELPVYDLVVARSDRRLGPKVSRASFDCGARTTGAPPPRGPSGEELCSITQGPGRLTVRGYSMARFAGSLVTPVQRMVVDKTGLTGPWNLEVLYTPDQPVALNGAIVPPNPDAPSLFTAVQEQLGLKLESSRGPVEVLVIDRINRPTED